MRNVAHRCVVGHDDDTRADAGYAPKLDRELLRQPDAAVRSRIAGHDAGMQGYAGPGNALHVGHRRGGIDVGAVKALLLNDREDSRWRGVPGLPGRHGALRHQAGGVVDPYPLPGERDHGKNGAGCDPLGRLFPIGRTIAARLGVRGSHGAECGNSKCNRQQREQPTLPCGKKPQPSIALTHRLPPRYANHAAASYRHLRGCPRDPTATLRAAVVRMRYS